MHSTQTLGRLSDWKEILLSKNYHFLIMPGEFSAEDRATVSREVTTVSTKSTISAERLVRV